jgi:hypothetical protein
MPEKPTSQTGQKCRGMSFFVARFAENGGKAGG